MTIRLALAMTLWLLLPGCTEPPHVGVTVTNAPSIEDCIPGSATKPCQ